MSGKNEWLEKLRDFGQEHLLTFWDVLSEEEQSALGADINAVDFVQLRGLYAQRNDPNESSALAERATEPVTFYASGLREKVLSPESNVAMNLSRVIVRGEEALRAGKIAVAVVAGGQGTRLGFPHAKGMYPIGPVSGATLFQIHIERIRAMARKYKTRIPFCVQTSPATHFETVDFFLAHENFGLADEDVLIFCQGTIPSVGAEDGRVLLAEKGKIARSPDGHGGFLACINAPAPEASTEMARREGVLADLVSRGVEEIFYFQIDNPVIDLASPEFIGYHLENNSEFSSQVVRKATPHDRVGNMVMVDGRLHVIEYSDLPDAAAHRRKEDGSLEIWAGSIAVHLMNVAFLRDKAKLADSLPFHRAKKKVPYVETDPTARDEGAYRFGSVVQPTEPNGVKFEKFIFDLLPQAKNPIVVEMETATGFVPLKNHPSAPTDNPQSVQEGLANLYRRWLAAFGIRVADRCIVEISPLFANSATELQSRLRERNLWPANNIITESVYWSE